MAMDADDHIAADMAMHVGDDRLHLMWKRSTIRVAQHHVAGTLHHGGLQGPQGELGIALVPVEEVLHVDEHPATVARQERHRIGDHRLALVERGLQRVEHVVVPALGDDADRRRVGVEQVAQRGVVVDLALRAPSGTERDHRRGVEPQFGRGAGEELDVFRIGTRPSALDEVHTEVIELLGDAQLVVDRGRHALDLHSIAQRRVEDLDRILAHGSTLSVEMKEPPGWAARCAHRQMPRCASE